MIMRHKIKQLSDAKRLEDQLAVKLIDLYKKNIITSSCASIENCVKAANLCVDKGFLNLTRKGFQIAWSLQNPYITAVPKLGIAIKVVIRLKILGVPEKYNWARISQTG
jgi:hypothetical protein